MTPDRHPLADRQVLLLLAISLSSGLSMGYFSPLLTALMKDRGDSALEVGLVGTAYYLLVAAGALLAGAGTLRGALPVSLGLGFAGVFGLVVPFTRGTLELVLARAGGGLAVGVYSTLVQASLLGRTTERTRALLTAAQALSFGLGLALGPILVSTMYTLSPRAAFAAGGLLLLAMAGFAWMGLEGRRSAVRPAMGSVFRKVLFPLNAVFAYGFAEAALLSLYPLSLLERKVPLSTMATSCSVFVVGSLVSTLPVALAADRVGRKRALVACSGVGVGALVGLSMVQGFTPLVALSFLGGASLGPVYALALSLVRDGVAEAEVASGAASFNTSFSLGCIAGPGVSSFAMRQLGPAGVFVPALLLFGLVLVHAALVARQGARPAAGWSSSPEGVADP